jgi:V/A-type H+-transporting ATPase subunit E
MKQEDVVGLEEAVMSEVARDRQRILTDAEVQARRMREDARAEAEAKKAELIRDAEARAARVEQEATGAARLEAQALKMRQREALLDAVFTEAADRLSDVDRLAAYEDVLEDLIQDAVRHLAGQAELVVRADVRARESLDASRLARLRELTGCALSLGETLAPPAVGVVVQSPDGRVRYDNTLQTRLGRMRSSLRPAVYRTLMGDEA